jgi:hypothetical protein
MQSTVFAKTEAGRTEIDQRIRGLTAKERRVLILIDAQRNVFDIATITDLNDDAASVFVRLIGLGLIAPLASQGESRVASRPAPPAPPLPSAPQKTAGADATAAKTVVDEALARAKKIMLEATDEHLGLLGADIARHIDGVNDFDSIKACIAKWHMAMRDSRSGRASVDEHLERIRAALATQPQEA